MRRGRWTLVLALLWGCTSGREVLPEPDANANANANADANADADADANADANANANADADTDADAAADAGPPPLWRALGGPSEHAYLTSLASDGKRIVAAGYDAPILRSTDGGAHFELWPDDLSRTRWLGARGAIVSRGKVVLATSHGLFAADASGGPFARILAPWTWPSTTVTTGYAGIAATPSGAWIAITGFDVDHRGVVRRSLDGGLTWTSQTGFVSSPFVRADGETVLLGEETSGRVLRSTDAGATFTAIDTGYGPVLDAVVTKTRLVAAKTNALVTLPLAGGAPTDVARIGSTEPAFRSLVREGERVVAPSYFGTQRTADGGATWSSAPWVPFTPSGGGLALSGAMLVPTARDGLQRTTDDGASFTSTGRGAQATRVWQVVPHPTTPSTLYAIEYDRNTLVRSKDDGATWTDVKYGGCMNVALSAGAILVLGQGMVLRSVDDGATFVPVFSYLGAPSPMMVTSGAVVLINSGKGFARSTDFGLTWTEHLAPVLDHRLAVSPSGGLFLATVADGVMRSTDLGLTWKHSTTPMGRPADVTVAPDGVAWAFADGKLLRSTDEGETWSVEPAPAEPVDWWEMRLGTTPAGQLLVPGYRLDTFGNRVLTLYRRGADGAFERWDAGLFTTTVWGYTRVGDRLLVATQGGVFRTTR